MRYPLHFPAHRVWALRHGTKVVRFYQHCEAHSALLSLMLISLFFFGGYLNIWSEYYGLIYDAN